MFRGVARISEKGGRVDYHVQSVRKSLSRKPRPSITSHAYGYYCLLCMKAITRSHTKATQDSINVNKSKSKSEMDLLASVTKQNMPRMTSGELDRRTVLMRLSPLKDRSALQEVTGRVQRTVTRAWSLGKIQIF